MPNPRLTRSESFVRWMHMNGLNTNQVSRVSSVPYNTLVSFSKRPTAVMGGDNEAQVAGAFGVPIEHIFDRPCRMTKLPPVLDDDSKAQRRFKEVMEEPGSGEWPTCNPDTPEPHGAEELPTSRRLDGLVEIPAYDIKLAAGGGYYPQEYPEVQPWRLPTNFISGELGLNPETLSVVEVVGISMQPTLMPRDKILIDQSDRNPSPPGIFAVWDGHGLLVKNVQRISEKRDWVRLSSDNPTYAPQEYFLEDITIIGRVVWFSRRI